MKLRWIPVLLLLAAGCGALFWLQRNSVETEITPRPLLYLVADAQRELERLPLRLTRVNSEEEMRAGEELARRYDSLVEENSAETAHLHAEVVRVGERVANKVKRRKIRYLFHVIGDQHFRNAFALPGGQIFLGRGLVDLLETEDELAALLGHEIAHVDERHAIERLQYELQVRKIGLSGLLGLAKFPVRLFQAGYTKEKELEADRAGLALAVAAGYSSAGGPALMRRLAQLAPEKKRQYRSPVGEAVSVTLQTLPEYFRSHPPPEERLARLEREIDARGWDASQPQQPLEIKKSAPQPADP